MLDSEAQRLMLSRQHAKLQYTPCKGWHVLDLESTNGVLHNGIRVSEALLQHGDEITFGGGRNTGIGQRPGPKAPKSIYTYVFYHQVELSPSRPPPARAASEECVSPILSRGASHISTEKASHKQDIARTGKSDELSVVDRGMTTKHSVDDLCTSPILMRCASADQKRESAQTAPRLHNSVDCGLSETIGVDDAAPRAMAVDGDGESKSTATGGELPEAIALEDSKSAPGCQQPPITSHEHVPQAGNSDGQLQNKDERTSGRRPDRASAQHATVGICGKRKISEKRKISDAERARGKKEKEKPVRRERQRERDRLFQEEVDRLTHQLTGRQESAVLSMAAGDDGGAFCATAGVKKRKIEDGENTFSRNGDVARSQKLSIAERLERAEEESQIERDMDRSCGGRGESRRLVDTRGGALSMERDMEKERARQRKTKEQAMLRCAFACAQRTPHYVLVS